ncbi:hypothetical protein WN943_013545 [Citrus x changshan-huyou]
MAFSAPLSSRIRNSTRALPSIFATVYVLLLSCSFSAQCHEFTSLSKSEAHTGLNSNVLNIKRSNFPANFSFGASTSAAQIEGATTEDGRGPSIWDDFIERYPGKVMNGNDLITAIDSYRRYKEDMKAVKELGVDSYRFSISWTRILPSIKPFVTIFHFDSPQGLQEKDDFKDYAEICFKSFGDRVKNWMTINEPLIASKYGYESGTAAPGRCSDRNNCPAGNSSTEPYIASHNFLLAHAAAFRLYEQKFRAKQAEEKKLVKGAFDFIGLNYYTTNYAKSIPMNSNDPPVSVTADQFVDFTVERDGVLIGPEAEGSGYIYIYPKGMQQVLEYVKNNYQNPAIYITENGVTEQRNDNLTLDVALKDEHRVDFVLGHLYYLHEAIKNGVNVKGYFYWSAFDDFEWGIGYLPRFGLYFIDYNNNLTRIPKESAKWVRDFLEGYTPRFGFYFIDYNNLTRIPKEPAKGFHDFLKTAAKRAMDFELGWFMEPLVYGDFPKTMRQIVKDRLPRWSDEEKNLVKGCFDFIGVNYYTTRKGANVKGYFYWTLFDDFEWSEGFNPRHGLYYTDYKNNPTRIPKDSAKCSSEIVLGLYGYKMGSKTKNPKPATDPYPATHHIILAHSAAAAKHKENYQALVRDGFPRFSEEKKDLIKGAYDL